MTQAGIEHINSSDSPGHAIPPLDGVKIVRERDIVPAPHVTEQAPQADHADTTQLTGHAPVAQSSDSVAEPKQDAPPQTASVCARDRDRRPPPHVAEQADHCAHPPNEQATGQHVLHCSVSVSSTHEPPHNSLCILVRERDRMPLPHVTEHVDHDDQPLTVQSLGQQPPGHRHVPSSGTGRLRWCRTAAMSSLRCATLGGTGSSE
jgi:hypothetical protein